jgi:hypothetical protein
LRTHCGRGLTELGPVGGPDDGQYRASFWGRATWNRG